MFTLRQRDDNASLQYCALQTAWSERSTTTINAHVRHLLVMCIASLLPGNVHAMRRGTAQRGTIQ